MCSLMQDIICGMAFGKSWGVVRDATQQVHAGDVGIGPVGEAVFKTTRPPLAESTIRLLDVSC